MSFPTPRWPAPARAVPDDQPSWRHGFPREIKPWLHRSTAGNEGKFDTRVYVVCNPQGGYPGTIPPRALGTRALTVVSEFRPGYGFWQRPGKSIW